MPTNKYGMPNGAYAQSAQAAKSGNREEENPIADALQNNAAPLSNGVAQAAADPNVAVTRTGQPNLTAAPPPGRMQSGVVDRTTAPTTEQQALQNVLVPPIQGRYTNGDSDYRDAYQITNNAYNQFLHRDASQPEIDSHFLAQGWAPGGKNNGVIGSNGLNFILNGIANSDEARNYVAPPPTPPPVAPPTPDGQPKTLEEAMAYANKTAYGYDKHTDPTYWQALYAKDPAYALKRMMGMGAGKQDAAQFGEWAGGDPNAEAFGAKSSPTLPSNYTPNSNAALMSALAGGQNMGSDYAKNLIQQLMQSLATQNALFK